MKGVHVTCPTCQGCGQVPFARAHPQLAKLCQRMYACGPFTASELQTGDPYVGVTGYNNRLEKLRELGFAERQKVGRRWVYSLTESGEAVAKQGPG